MNPVRSLPVVALLLTPVLSAPAQTRLPDPIAYSCYFCTDEEMEQVAIDQGAGEHYVYDVNRDPSFTGRSGIHGYRVSLEGSGASVVRFEPDAWLMRQYAALMRAYSPSQGAPVHKVGNVSLLPPDSHHGRASGPVYLWGHHTSALNPLHTRARETVERWIAANVDLDHLRADAEHGRVLQFWFQKGGMNPTLLRLMPPGGGHGYIDYAMDRATRRWTYHGAYSWWPVEERQDDFVGPLGHRQFEATRIQAMQMDAFVQRARWAGVVLHGQFNPLLTNYVDCRIEGGAPTCTIAQTR